MKSVKTCIFNQIAGGTMKSKVTFNKSGSNSVSGRVTIPSAYLEILGITCDDREIYIVCDGEKIIIEKMNKHT